MITLRNIPALRFPEFSEELNKEKISTTYSFRITNSLSRDNLNYEEGEVRNIHYGDIHTKFSTLFDINRELVPFINPSISLNRISEDNYCKEGDVIFADASEDLADVGKAIELIAVKPYRLLSGLHTLLARPVPNTFSIGYSGYLFQSSFVRFQIQKEAQGSKVLSISTKRLSNVKIFYPSLVEQQKIVSFLTVIDNKTEFLIRKKTLLEQYKKGVMQQIFNKKFRFVTDVGDPYPAWERIKLGDLLSFHSTNSFSRDLLTYDTGAVKNIHYGDIHTKFKTQFDVNKENVPYVKEAVDLSRISEDSYCQEGDLVIADASEDYNDIGKSIEIVNTDGQLLLAGLHTYIARDKQENALGFKGYLMQTSNVRRQIMRLAAGISVLGISKKQLASVIVDIPSFPEQQKIASFLGAIDAKINAVDQQLTLTKTFKKGLLQQLFV